MFKDNNQISSTISTRTLALSTGMDQNVAKYWYPNEKMVVVHGYSIVLTKTKAMSLSFL